MGAPSAADQEVRKYLADARRALQNAIRVAEGLAKGRDPVAQKLDSLLDRRAVLARIQAKALQDQIGPSRDQVLRSKRVASRLREILGSLDTVGILQPDWDRMDPDLIPESVKDQWREAERRKRQTERQKHPRQSLTRRVVDEVKADGTDE